MQLIDLSHPITESMPVYPGDPHTKIELKGILQKDGFKDHYLSIGTHAGTHIDAPNHVLMNGKPLDQFPLDKFTGKGVYIPIKDNEFDLPTITTFDIEEGDILLFDTRMSEKFYEKDYFEKYPTFPEEITRFLIEKKVKMVGVDMCSVDHEEFTIHKILLENDVLILENLTNLQLLKDKQFTLYAFPLKMSLDSSPVRVVAERKTSL